MFITPNLDEAAFLYIKGYLPTKYLRTSTNSATFYYQNKVKSLIEQFRQGKAVCNVIRFMYARRILKEILKSEPIEEARLTFHSFMGKGYWYIVNKTILHAVAGVDNVHLERYRDGNFFATKDEAHAKLKLDTPTYTHPSV